MVVVAVMVMRLVMVIEVSKDRVKGGELGYDPGDVYEAEGVDGQSRHNTLAKRATQVNFSSGDLYGCAGPWPFAKRNARSSTFRPKGAEIITKFVFSRPKSRSYSGNEKVRRPFSTILGRSW